MALWGGDNLFWIPALKLDCRNILTVIWINIFRLWSSTTYVGIVQFCAEDSCNPLNILDFVDRITSTFLLVQFCHIKLSQLVAVLLWEENLIQSSAKVEICSVDCRVRRSSGIFGTSLCSLILTKQTWKYIYIFATIWNKHSLQVLMVDFLKNYQMHQD